MFTTNYTLLRGCVLNKINYIAIKQAAIKTAEQSKPSTQPLLLLVAIFPDVDFLLSKAEKSFGCFARKWRSIFVVWPKYKTVFIQRRHNTRLSSSAWKNDHTMLRFRAAIWESVLFWTLLLRHYLLPPSGLAVCRWWNVFWKTYRSDRENIRNPSF